MPTKAKKQNLEKPRQDEREDPYRRNREADDLNTSQQEEENRSARQRAVKKHPGDKSGPA